MTDNATAGIANGSEGVSPEMPEYARAAFSDNCFNRPGDPYDDVAPIVVWLTCDESKWLTGQTVNADGGGWVCA